MTKTVQTGQRGHHHRTSVIALATAGVSALMNRFGQHLAASLPVPQNQRRHVSMSTNDTAMARPFLRRDTDALSISRPNSALTRTDAGAKQQKQTLLAALARTMGLVNDAATVSDKQHDSGQHGFGTHLGAFAAAA